MRKYLHRAAWMAHDWYPKEFINYLCSVAILASVVLFVAFFVSGISWVISELARVMGWY